jgi:transposase
VEKIAQLIRDEKDPAKLREISLFILEQSSHLAAENARLKAKRAREESEKETYLNSELETHLHKLKRRLFGHGRETLGARDYERKVDDQKELLLHAKSLVGDALPTQNHNLPKVEAFYSASVEELIALAQIKDPLLTLDSAKVEEMPGFYEEATEITITERTFKQVIHKRKKFKVIHTETKKETIVTAKGPVKLLPGCKYSVDFALSIVAGKFLNHLPCDRQRKELRRLGLRVPTMTLTRLCEMVAIHMEKTVDKIREDIFNANLSCHLDETRWPILNKHQDNGQMWILANQAGSFYKFEPTRSGEIADELLEGYTGPVLTDKFSGYLHLRKAKHIKWGLCWAHARREFFDLIDVYPDAVKPIIDAMDDLFDYEREAKTWDDLKLIRTLKSKPKTEEIRALLQKVQAEFFNRDELCKAAHYILSGWTEFTAFLEDTRLPLCNNAAERALRHAVLGRKNFNGSKTINGADTAATLYSVIESCKRAQLDPVDYMKYVITENHHGREPLTPLKRALDLRGTPTNGKERNNLISCSV